jgi:hypothetical protein
MKKALKKRIIKARLNGDEALATALETQDKLDNASETNEAVLSYLKSAEETHKKTSELITQVLEQKQEAPIVNVAAPEVKVESVDLSTLPAPQITVEKTDLSALSGISTAIGSILTWLKEKAASVLDVNVKNEYLKVRYVKKGRNGKLVEVEPNEMFNVTVSGGGGGPSVVGLKDENDVRVGPAKEDTLLKTIGFDKSLGMTILPSEDATYKYWQKTDGIKTQIITLHKTTKVVTKEWV